MQTFLSFEENESVYFQLQGLVRGLKIRLAKWYNSVLSFQRMQLEFFCCFFNCKGFMMELTAHQGRVGNVLQVGSQLLSTGKLSDEEENEIQEQMNLLNSRWESLRVASMEKQSK